MASFAHSTPPMAPICRYFTLGKCAAGPNRCRFRHPGVPHCSFFAAGTCTKGDDCKFLHVPPRKKSKGSHALALAASSTTPAASAALAKKGRPFSTKAAAASPASLEEVFEEVTIVKKRIVKKASAASAAPKPQSPPVAAAPAVIEVVLCFDTTGSMYPYLDAVRSGLGGLIESLVAKSKRHGAQLRLGVIAHGDYCDHGSAYVIKYLPLLDASNKQALDKLAKFVADVGPTSGGDGPECYELALHKACLSMGWSPACRSRTLVMVGDATPHPVGYKHGSFTNALDWNAELKALARKHVRIYAVQAGGSSSGSTAAFWQALASQTKGKHLSVREMRTLSDLITAAVCKEVGDSAYEELGRELEARGAMRGEVAHVYEELRTVSTRRVVVSHGHGAAAAAAAVAAGFAIKAAGAGGGGGGGGGKAKKSPALLTPGGAKKKTVRWGK